MPTRKKRIGFYHQNPSEVCYSGNLNIGVWLWYIIAQKHYNVNILFQAYPVTVLTIKVNVILVDRATAEAMPEISVPDSIHIVDDVHIFLGQTGAEEDLAVHAGEIDMGLIVVAFIYKLTEACVFKLLCNVSAHLKIINSDRRAYHADNVLDIRAVLSDKSFYFLLKYSNKRTSP